MGARVVAFKYIKGSFKERFTMVFELSISNGFGRELDYHWKFHLERLLSENQLTGFNVSKTFNRVLIEVKFKNEAEMFQYKTEYASIIKDVVKQLNEIMAQKALEKYQAQTKQKRKAQNLKLINKEFENDKRIPTEILDDNEITDDELIEVIANYDKELIYIRLDDLRERFLKNDNDRLKRSMHNFKRVSKIKTVLKVSKLDGFWYYSNGPRTSNTKLLNKDSGNRHENPDEHASSSQLYIWFIISALPLFIIVLIFIILAFQ